MSRLTDVAQLRYLRAAHSDGHGAWVSPPVPRVQPPSPSNNFCPPGAGSCSCAGLVCTISGSYTLPAGSTLIVPLNASLIVQGNLVLAAGSAVAVQLDASGSTAVVPVEISGTVQLHGALTLQGLSSNAPITITVLQAQGGLLGSSFDTIALNTTTSGAACAQPTYTATTLSVTVTPGSCNGGGLSVGAIVGIVVGAVVCGALVAFFMLAYMRYKWRKAALELHKVDMQAF